MAQSMNLNVCSDTQTVLKEYDPNQIDIFVDNIVASPLNKSSSQSPQSYLVDKAEHEEVLSSCIQVRRKKSLGQNLANHFFDIFTLGSSVSNFLQRLKSNRNEDIYYCLVVDDDKFTRESNIRIIREVSFSHNLNIEIFQAEDGIECVYLVYKLLNEGIKISLIFSDETMYYMRGTKSYEIVKDILCSKNISPIPFILVTAYEDYSYPNDVNLKIISKPLSKSSTEMVMKKYIKKSL
jgi:CheY-like chemotaxis protein